MDIDALRLDLIRTIIQLPAAQLPAAAESLRQLPPTEAGRRSVGPLQSGEWPHAPRHQLGEAGTYMVTTGTYQKQHFFNSSERLDLLEQALLTTARRYDWHLEAWAVFSNHYHFVAYSDTPSSLREFVTDLHAATAREVNCLDGEEGRPVWHNYWDTQLTFEKSYLARLNYVHQNAVKHGLVPVANQYRWCSAAWLERSASPAQLKTIYGFKIDQLRVKDEFNPIAVI
jgi:putative transposase